MDNEQRPYFAYMLRLWCVSANGDVVWRASIEDPHTGERHGFASLEQLFKFLERQAREASYGECQTANQTTDINRITPGSPK
jgi:hypothetical protein